MKTNFIQRAVWPIFSCMVIVFGIQKAAYGQQLVNEFTVSPGGDIDNLSIDLGNEKCQDFINEKRWIEGKNVKKDGSPFFVAIGDTPINAPVGTPNYITSRENAFDTAFLKAKGEMARYIELSVAQETKATYQEGKFSDPEPTNQQPDSAVKNIQDDQNIRGAFDKTLKLIHNSLDKELESRGVGESKADKVPEEVIEREIDKILSEQKFKKIVETVAKTQLKGVRRMYVSETAKPGEQGSICVVMLHSVKYEQLADALLARDESMIPRAAPNRPIRSQVPDRKRGVRQLMASYGVEILRDERGALWIVSYGQHGARSKKKSHINSAISFATNRATGNLRAFVSEQMDVRNKTENSENTRELVGNMNEYEFNNAMRESYKSKSKALKINGISKLFVWAAKHPTTGQIIGGSVVTWSPDDMKYGQQLKSSANRTPRDRSGQNSGQSPNSRFSDQEYKRRQGAGGERRGGTSDQDF